MSLIDENDAPAGYRAVKPKRFPHCDGCAFDTSFDAKIAGKCIASPCYGRGRADRQYVIFVRRDQPSKPATVSYPCGSLGEEIHDAGPAT